MSNSEASSIDRLFFLLLFANKAREQKIILLVVQTPKSALNGSEFVVVNEIESKLVNMQG